MRSGCARSKITWTARTVSQNARSNFSPPSCAITFTALVCSIGIVGQLFGDTVEKGRGRNERSEARAWWSRHQADQNGKTWQIALSDVVVVQSSSSLISSARYDRKTWPAFVQLHAPPFPPKSSRRELLPITGQTRSIRLKAWTLSRRHVACEKLAVDESCVQRNGHKKGSWWTVNKKKKPWVSRRCDT